MTRTLPLTCDAVENRDQRPGQQNRGDAPTHPLERLAAAAVPALVRNGRLADTEADATGTRQDQQPQPVPNSLLAGPVSPSIFVAFAPGMMSSTSVSVYT
ncbi:hypothetical protein ACWCP6_28555 [Streptomyces sp. NPDC002004]